MFDIGFFELLVIALVALFVVGPERLPKLIITISRYIKRMQGFWNDAKYEIEREIHNAEIKKVTDDIGDDLHEIVNDIDDEMQAIADDGKKATKSNQG